jgi:tRNA(His) 5'-end guanylyltransferase
MNYEEPEFIKEIERYESAETSRKSESDQPIVIRVDGKGFSKFTKNFDKPFDMMFVKAMKAATVATMELLGAQYGYTQSDEATFILFNENEKSEHYFGGRFQKLVSISACAFSYQFNLNLGKHNLYDKFALFDSRAFGVPDLKAAAQVIAWRESDAIRNSVSNAANELFSHNELMKKSTKEKKNMMLSKGYDWEKLENGLKRGYHFVRKEIEKSFSVEELELLPKEHDARKNPDLKIKRKEIVEATKVNSGQLIKTFSDPSLIFFMEK